MAGGSDIRAGRAFIELYLRNRVAGGLRRASQQMVAYSGTVRGIGTKIAGVGAAIVGPLAGAVKYFASAGDALDKMSSRVGASVEFLSALGHAAQIGGTDIAAMEVGFRRMQRTAFDASRGLSTATEAFGQLGVSVKRSDGQLKSTEMLFMESAAALSRMENNTQKAALATVIFGRAGTKLLPMLKDGAGRIQALMAEAEALGIVISKDDADAAAVLTDAFTRLQTSIKAVYFRVGAALAPMLTDLAKRIRENITPLIEWVRNNQQLIIVVAKVGAIVAAVGAAILGLSGVLAVVGAGLGGLATLASVAGTVLGALFSQTGILVAAVAGLGYALLFHTDAGGAALDWLGQQFQRLLGFVMPIVKGIKDALSAGDIQLAAKILWLGLKTAFVKGKQMVMSVWRPFTEGFLNVFDAAITKLRQIWNSVSGWLAKKMLQLWGIISKISAKLGLLQEFDPSEAIQALEQETARGNRRLDKDRQKRAAARARRTDTGFEADERELAKLREQLAKSITQARTEAIEAELKRRKSKEREQPPVPSAAESVDQVSSRGTFSAYAARLIGRGGSQQVQLLQEISGEMKKLNRTVDEAEGGLVFE